MSASGPAVPFPPPLIYVAGLLAAHGLDRVLALPSLPAAWQGAAGVVGRLFVALGVALMIAGIVSFARARTTMVPNRAASRMVESGPYRFTRNPMYVGLAAAYLGVAAILGNAWGLVLFPLVVVAMNRIVIAREEAYLSERFGSDYDAYRSRVRRWI